MTDAGQGPWTPELLGQMRDAFGRSYQVVNEVKESGGVRQVIVCLYCGRGSYNLNDIAEKYCGACHRFHEEEA